MFLELGGYRRLLDRSLSLPLFEAPVFKNSNRLRADTHFLHAQLNFLIEPFIIFLRRRKLLLLVFFRIQIVKARCIEADAGRIGLVPNSIMHILPIRRLKTGRIVLCHDLGHFLIDFDGALLSLMTLLYSLVQCQLLI